MSHKNIFLITNTTSRPYLLLLAVRHLITGSLLLIVLKSCHINLVYRRIILTTIMIEWLIFNFFLLLSNKDKLWEAATSKQMHVFMLGMRNCVCIENTCKLWYNSTMLTHKNFETFTTRRTLIAKYWYLQQQIQR